MIFSALGLPMKWTKYRGGFVVQWIGYELNFETWALGISEPRAEWLRGWLMKRLEEMTVDLGDLCAVLGRLSFAMGPLAHLRAFMAPIYAWSAAVGRKGRMRLPWSIAFLFKVIYDSLGGAGRYIEIEDQVQDLGEAFRSDAKAEGDVVVVGGWECLGGRRPGEARWYSEKLDRKSAPWAFSKGEPFRTIAALELYGTLLSIMAFSGEWPRSASGRITVSASTDNSGNAQVLSRLMSSKFPLVVVLAELSAQIKAKGLRLNLGWVPREENEEADELTNRETGRFDPARRVKLDIGNLNWICLGGYMAAATSLYEEVVATKKRTEQSAAGARKKPRPLRERDPWQ